MRSEIVVEFHGPFSWHGSEEAPCIFSSDMGEKSGVYLWTVKYKDGDLVYYVGETGRKFSVRMLEHFREHMSEGYPICTSLWSLSGGTR